MSIDINITSRFTSFDGNHIVATRIDGSLFMQFDDGKRYGMGYFADPYKSSPDDITPSSMGFKSVAVEGNTIIMAKNYDDMHIGTFDVYSMDNIQKVDDTFNLGSSSIDWHLCKNPYKKPLEHYQCIGFINKDFVYAISVDKSQTIPILSKYIYNIKTNEWKNTFVDSEDNWVDKDKIFVIDYTKDTDNVTIIFIDNVDGVDIIKQKIITIKDIKNIGCSRDAKVFSKFDAKTNSIKVISYKQIYENNFDYKSYPIIFEDEKEFYTHHNISTNAFIVTTNKNIYVKLFEDDIDAKWRPILYVGVDTYIINDMNDEFIDTTSTFWNSIKVSGSSCLITTLIGDIFVLSNITNESFNFKRTRLPTIFCDSDMFNSTFGKSTFVDRFTNSYKIQYFNAESENTQADTVISQSETEKVTNWMKNVMGIKKN